MHIRTWCLPTARNWISEQSVQRHFIIEGRWAGRYEQVQTAINLTSRWEWPLVLSIRKSYVSDMDLRFLHSHHPRCFHLIRLFFPPWHNLPSRDETIPPWSKFTVTDKFQGITYRSLYGFFLFTSLFRHSVTERFTFMMKRQKQNAKHGMISTCKLASQSVRLFIFIFIIYTSLILYARRLKTITPTLYIRTSHKSRAAEYYDRGVPADSIWTSQSLRTFIVVLCDLGGFSSFWASTSSEVEKDWLCGPEICVRVPIPSARG